jgi:Fe-S-cluster containining protein
VVDDKSGMSHPFYMIKDRCIQYDTKSHKCKIYKDRAYSCATYPFSITLDKKLVRSKFCNGFGKGNRVDRKKMINYIYRWRKRAGMQV